MTPNLSSVEGTVKKENMICADLQKITTQNGHAIVASFFRPVGEVKASVLIVSAMGTSQKYYAPLAAWLHGGPDLRPADSRRPLRCD